MQLRISKDTGGNLTEDDLGFGDNFLEAPPKSQSTEERIGKLDFDKMQD